MFRKKTQEARIGRRPGRCLGCGKKTRRRSNICSPRCSKDAAAAL